MTIIHEPMAAYLARSEMSRGDLEAAFNGPRSWTAHLAKQADDTPYLGFGNLVHSMVENNGQLGDGYFMEPPLPTGYAKPRSTKDYKIAVVALKAANPGGQMITADDKERARVCYDALSSHPEAKKLLFHQRMESEPTIIFNSDGIDWRIRPDVLSSWGEGVAIVDLKTASDPSPHGFKSSAKKFGYNFSPHLYGAGVHVEFGLPVEFFWVVVGSQPPHHVKVYRAGDERMGLSRELYWKGLVNLREYIQAAPSPRLHDDPGIIDLDVAAWESPVPDDEDQDGVSYEPQFGNSES